MSPVRLLDTRVPTPSGVSKLKADVPMRFPVGGRGGVPEGAIAVTGNLTVVGQTAAGYVTLGPIVGPNPATSTLNIPKSDVRGDDTKADTTPTIAESTKKAGTRG